MILISNIKPLIDWHEKLKFILLLFIELEDSFGCPFWVEDVKHNDWDDIAKDHADVGWDRHFKNRQMKQNLQSPDHHYEIVH